MKKGNADKQIALGCDHRGYPMKERLKGFLKTEGYEPVDCGTFSEEAADYPDFIIKAAEMVRQGQCARAIGICHSGIGSSIVANKVKGIRASLCQNVQQAALTRQHNDSNMLILASGFLQDQDVLPLVKVWLNTPFEGGRHERRVNKITDYEQQNCK